MKSEEDLKWITDSRTKVFSSPILSLDVVHRFAKDGREGDFVTLSNPDAVIILPLIRREDGEEVFIMENQFRHGSENVTREFPAGLIEEGERSEDAAKRELLEETGMKGKLTMLAQFSPNPAFMNNTHFVYLCTELEKCSEQKLDQNEEIEIVEVPLSSLMKDAFKKPYNNSSTLVALLYYLLYKENLK